MCNCAGSLRNNTPVPPAERTSRDNGSRQEPPRPRTGGPGQEGYYWTGPRRSDNKN